MARDDTVMCGSPNTLIQVWPLLMKWWMTIMQVHSLAANCHRWFPSNS